MKPLLLVAALNGFVAVTAGAFGAHALRDRLTPRQFDVYETAARYQLPHAVAAVAAAILGRRSRLARGAGWLFIIGSVLFAGSLYALALTDLRWLGLITPIGGLAFLAGWAALGVAALRAGPASQDPA